MFGSLTNEFGDRFKSSNEMSMQVRTLSRIISYQIKLLIRCSDKIISIDVLIIRHAQTLEKFKYPRSINNFCDGKFSSIFERRSRTAGS